MARHNIRGNSNKGRGLTPAAVKSPLHTHNLPLRTPTKHPYAPDTQVDDAAYKSWSKLLLHPGKHFGKAAEVGNQVGSTSFGIALWITL